MSDEEDVKEKRFSQEGYIHHKFLGRCDGESPKESLKFLHKVLSHIKNNWGTICFGSEEARDFDNKLNAICGNNMGIKMTVLFMLDNYEIIDHVEFDVPGWLTPKGNELLDALNKMYGEIDG